MNYVDGFVTPVPKRKVEAYRRFARKGAKVFRQHGALEYRECIADDLPPAKGVSFPRSVKLKPGEIVFFSWIVYKSRAHRDRVMAKAMKDPAFAHVDPKTLPFDWKRTVYGGFKIVVESKSRGRTS